MKVLSARTGLAAIVTLGGFAVAAHAQPPAVPVQPVPVAPAAPQVFKWPGGYMVMNGQEVILRSTTPNGSSTNLITGSGNGIGNKIVVSGGTGGVTIVKGARNGIGNRIIIDPNDVFLDLDALLDGVKPAAPVVPVPPQGAVPVIPPAAVPAPAVNPAPAPAPEPAAPNAAPATPPSYKGKASPFWTKKAFSDAYDCNLYWDPTNKLWFRYTAEDDTYHPVPAQPAPPAEEK